MLYILASILVAFWIIGMALKIGASFIHLALIAAFVLFVVGVFQSRTPSRGSRVT